MSTAAAQPDASPSRTRHTRWQRARPLALLALGGVSLYILLPSLLTVFGSWRSLSHVD